MFEKHDQLFTNVATEYLVNAMQNYLKENPEAFKKVSDELSAEAFVIKFLEVSKIYYYFHKEGIKEDATADDLLTYGRDMSSRLILSLVFDRCEKEQDPVGMRAIRRIMISYFLNRKEKIQDSKVNIYRCAVVGS